MPTNQIAQRRKLNHQIELYFVLYLPAACVPGLATHLDVQAAGGWVGGCEGGWQVVGALLGRVDAWTVVC